jgi:hypothetical protein
MIQGSEKQSKQSLKRAKATKQFTKDSKRIKFLQTMIQLEQNRPRLKKFRANSSRDE